MPTPTGDPTASTLWRRSGEPFCTGLVPGRDLGMGTVLKFNPNHDDHGRFATSPGGAAGSAGSIGVIDRPHFGGDNPGPYPSTWDPSRPIHPRDVLPFLHPDAEIDIPVEDMNYNLTMGNGTAIEQGTLAGLYDFAQAYPSAAKKIGYVHFDPDYNRAIAEVAPTENLTSHETAYEVVFGPQISATERDNFSIANTIGPSTYGATNRDYAYAVMTHELGHVVHLEATSSWIASNRTQAVVLAAEYGQTPFTEDGRRMLGAGKGIPIGWRSLQEIQPISEYASTGHFGETFAEAFVLTKDKSAQAGWSKMNGPGGKEFIDKASDVVDRVDDFLTSPVAKYSPSQPRDTDGRWRGMSLTLPSNPTLNDVQSALGAHPGHWWSKSFGVAGRYAVPKPGQTGVMLRGESKGWTEDAEGQAISTTDQAVTITDVQLWDAETRTWHTLVEKFNPNHGSDGRFTSGPGNAGIAGLSRNWAARTVVTSGIDNGGFTYHPGSNTQPSSGYVVAVQGFNKEVPLSDPTDPAQRKKVAQALVAYVKQHRSKFAENPQLHLGGWHDTEHNEFVFDLTEVVRDRDEAVRLGRERNQQAIWHLDTSTEIDTGGTGDRTDKARSGSPAGERDGRGTGAVGRGDGRPGPRPAVVFDPFGLTEHVEEIQKFNPNHDDRGRFARGDGSPSLTTLPSTPTSFASSVLAKLSEDDLVTDDTMLNDSIDREYQQTFANAYRIRMAAREIIGVGAGRYEPTNSYGESIDPETTSYTAGFGEEIKHDDFAYALNLMDRVHNSSPIDAGPDKMWRGIADTTEKWSKVKPGDIIDNPLISFRPDFEAGPGGASVVDFAYRVPGDGKVYLPSELHPTVIHVVGPVKGIYPKGKASQVNEDGEAWEFLTGGRFKVKSSRMTNVNLDPYREITIEQVGTYAPPAIPTPSDVAKFNPNHDNLGRFAESNGFSGTPGSSDPAHPAMGHSITGAGVGLSSDASLPADYATKAAARMKELGLTQAGLEASLEDALARCGNLDHADWYPEINQLVNKWSDRYGVSVEQVAGVVAVIAPMRIFYDPKNTARSDSNVAAAHTILETLHGDKKFEVKQEAIDAFNKSVDRTNARFKNMEPLPYADISPGSYKPSQITNSALLVAVNPSLYAVKNSSGLANLTKAVDIYRGGNINEIIGGPKIRSFYNNIANPDDHTTTTIDTWMMRLMIPRTHKMTLTHPTGGRKKYTWPEYTGRDLAMVDGKFVKKKQKSIQDIVQSVPGGKTVKGKKVFPDSVGLYPVFNDALVNVAKRHNMAPHGLQAVLWEVARQDAGLAPSLTDFDTSIW